MKQGGIMTNVPDFDAGIDAAGIEAEEIALGAEAASLSSKKHIHIIPIIVSAFVFLIILSWFDFIQTTFYEYMDQQKMKEEISSVVKFWTAVMLTFIIGIMLLLIYYYQK